jgi:hypothetical protein
MTLLVNKTTFWARIPKQFQNSTIRHYLPYILSHVLSFQKSQIHAETLRVSLQYQFILSSFRFALTFNLWTRGSQGIRHEITTCQFLRRVCAFRISSCWKITNIRPMFLNHESAWDLSNSTYNHCMRSANERSREVEESGDWSKADPPPPDT